MSVRLRVCAVLLAAGLSCCSPPAAPVVADGPATPAPADSEPAPAPYELAQPQVTMRADPAPPFTYWAPEGATIRNHVDVPGIWNAFVDGKNVATYYGDDCKASDYQRFVGQDLDAFPAPPSGMEVRPSCRGCPVHSDLRRNRINVIFNDATRVIVEVACY